MPETGWFTLGKLMWSRVVGFLPNWILKKAYPPLKLKERILIFPSGAISCGPQFNLTPGKPLSLETNELVVVNLLPFPVDLENVQAEVLLEGVYLGSKEKNFSLPIGKTTSTIVNLRFGLTDNEAGIVRNYPSNCPVLQMGLTANFRTSWGLLPLRFDVRTRAIINEVNGIRLVQAAR
jgi:hypothetical protein